MRASARERARGAAGGFREGGGAERMGGEGKKEGMVRRGLGDSCCNLSVLPFPHRHLLAFCSAAFGPSRARKQSACVSLPPAHARITLFQLP